MRIGVKRGFRRAVSSPVRNHTGGNVGVNQQACVRVAHGMQMQVLWQIASGYDSLQFVVHVRSQIEAAGQVRKHKVLVFPCRPQLEPLFRLQGFMFLQQPYDVFRQDNPARAVYGFWFLPDVFPADFHKRMPDKHHAHFKVYIIPVQGGQFPGADARRNEQVDNDFKLKIRLL